MNLTAFTRSLIDIDSTTGQEEAAAHLVADFLRQAGWAAELQEVEPGRYNVYAPLGTPRVVLSTHLDTVPPFMPSAEDDEFIYGRGACDAKGILAAQVFAALELQRQSRRDFGLLFLVGEEKNSQGARIANQRPNVCQFLVNGEPTDGQMVSAGKGTLRVDVTARGRMAHSAYPELGDSAIMKLLQALNALSELPLPASPELGPTTCNIGTIAGGRAPNVIADFARAEVMYRLVEPADSLRTLITAATAPYAEAQFVLEIPPVKLKTLPGFKTRTVAFTTDIPALTHWGEPLLYGPGSIHVAHTEHEKLSKLEQQQAVAGYVKIVQELLRAAEPSRK